MILISGIQQENRHIRALQQENKELRAALEEHQNAIELIMSKYRQHMNHLLHQTRLDSSFIVNREKAAVSAHNFVQRLVNQMRRETFLYSLNKPFFTVVAREDG